MGTDSLLDLISQGWQDRGWDLADLHLFRMEDDPDDDPDDPDDDPDDGDEDDDLEADDKGKVTLSQDRMTRIMKRERTKGKRSAAKELVKELGFKNVDELKAHIGKSKKADDDAKSEAQKAKEDADRLKQEAEDERKAVKKERFETRLERRLNKAKVKDDRLEKALKLLDLDEDNWDDEDDDLDEAISEFKEEYPEFFADEEGDGDENGDGKRLKKAKPRASGTKPPGQPRKKANDDPSSAAKARLAKRHPQTAKTK